MTVVTTFYPMFDFTRQVVQDHGDVSLLIPAGTEPHDFEPSAQMIAQIEDADVFVYNSDDMETWVPSALEAIDQDKVTIINASEGITFLEGDADEDEHHHDDDDHDDHEEEGHSHAVDPHVWLDPVLAQDEVTTIAEGLAKADPDNTDAYHENAATYNEKLQALDDAFKTAFDGAENREFVTQHAAFAYLAKRYDLTQVAISGLSPESEPSPAKLAELTDFVQEHDVHYIYYEENASSAIAETLANEVGVELLVLSPIEGVSQEDQDAGMDYIKVMEANLDALKKTIQ